MFTLLFFPLPFHVLPVLARVLSFVATVRVLLSATPSTAIFAPLSVSLFLPHLHNQTLCTAQLLFLPLRNHI